MLTNTVKPVWKFVKDLHLTEPSLAGLMKFMLVLVLDFALLACLTALIGYLFGAKVATAFVGVVLSAVLISMEIQMIKDGD